jgi:hypothetical protein
MAEDLDFQGVRSPRLSERPICHPLSLEESAKGVLYHERRFNVFRIMHEVRSFQLVFYADVWSGVGEYVVRDFTTWCARLPKMPISPTRAQRPGSPANTSHFDALITRYYLFNVAKYSAFVMLCEGQPKSAPGRGNRQLKTHPASMALHSKWLRSSGEFGCPVSRS